MIILGNIFIDSIKKFKENVYNNRNNIKLHYNEYRDIEKFGEFFWHSNKKQKNAVKTLLFSINNNPYKNIYNYIYKSYNENEEFFEWVKLINNFIDFVVEFVDPLLYNRGEKIKISIGKNRDFIYTSDRFKFTISFEKSNIRKTESSSLFDSITGLDKGKNLLFIRFSVENLVSNVVYNYEYLENGSIANNTGLDDDICNEQLEMVKNDLNDYLMVYIRNIFDQVIKEIVEEKSIIIFTSNIEDIYGDIWKKWMKDTE